MSIRLIHCLPTWLPITQNWIFNELNNLPPDEFQIHVVCERSENLDQFSVSYIHAIKSARLFGRTYDLMPWGLRQRMQDIFLLKVADRCEAQIVHSHFGHNAWRNQKAVSRIPARHVASFYGYDVNSLPTLYPYWRERYAELFAKVDIVLCEGPYMSRAIEALGCPASKLRIQRLGIDIEAIPFKPRFWQPGTPLRVLLAGRFVEKKGFPDALAALALLKADVDLEITIVGDAKPGMPDEQEKARILHAVEKGGLADRVRLLGFQPYDRLLAEAYAHHIFLAPSRSAANGDNEGGAPVTLIEMAASGMPIVSTRHCDIPSVVSDGVTGLLADERDTSRLAAHLKWFVDHPAEWLPMLAAGRAHIERDYDVRVQGRKLGDIYKSLL